MSQVTITPAIYWAAISPVKRGRRWIHYASLATTRRESRRLFIGEGMAEPYSSWTHWERLGWTIERVRLEPAR